MRMVSLCMMGLLMMGSARAEELNPKWLGLPFEAPIDLSFSTEIGFVGVLSHVIQFGRSGTEVDYLNDGAQNTLFPWTRFSADVTIAKRHTLVALYQPLDLETKQLLRRDIVVDDQLFPAGTPTNFGYSFPFWRLSYMYDFRPEPDQEIGIGVSLQIRNSTITFASADGTLLRSNENIGPVPVVKFRARHTFANRMFIGTEIDGFYASGRIITGSGNDFIGSLLDASLRAGMALGPAADVFLNVRFLGGGARGLEENTLGPGDGFARNWLYTFTVSLGFQLKATQARR
ncbi:MAG: hypothetical protein ACKVPX_03860 [Myxococcaceae bacterium]